MFQCCVACWFPFVAFNSPVISLGSTHIKQLFLGGKPLIKKLQPEQPTDKVSNQLMNTAELKDTRSQ